MKKLLFVLLCLAVFSAVAMAQTYTQGTGLTGKDILGAHQNGGRGCAGCHAPHSGGQGGGGNIGANATPFNDPLSGSNALFGQDVTPLYGVQFGFGSNGEFEFTLQQATAYTTQEEELRGIGMCLACHDGNVAKAGMMKGTAYEQRMGLLAPMNVYGTRPIPTLLGADGSTVGYQNDHPVGPAANLGAARVASKLTVVFNAADPYRIDSITSGDAAFSNFVANYGAPAIAGTSWAWGVAADGTRNKNNLFLLCTTCHNQHSMYIYSTNTKALSGPTGTYPTYFFVNSPYNPGSLQTGDNGAKASSATQFCRQCHFSMSNESKGVDGVVTAY